MKRIDTYIELAKSRKFFYAMRFLIRRHTCGNFITIQLLDMGIREIDDINKYEW